MRFLIQCLLLISFSLSAAAQDSAVLISPSMFDKTSDQLFIASIDGWIFKQGNNTAWANKNISTADWKKLKPIELNTTYADKNGKSAK